MYKIIPILILLSLQGCVNCTGPCAAIHGAAMVNEVTTTEQQGRKCSEMSGEDRKRCMDQVNAIKTSIAKQNVK